MAYLEYVIADQRYEAQLAAGSNSIGRARECKIQLLHDAELSRIHCTILRRSEGGYVLLDEGSTNGTCLNGDQVGTDEYPLKDGDRIRVGSTEFTFREQEPGRTTMLFTEVEQQMQRGEGFHTIMGKILNRPKKP